MGPILGLVLLLVLVGIYVATRKETEVATAAAASGSKLHWLVVTDGVDKGKSFHIGNRRVVVGRDVNAFVQLTDPAASRAQCQVVPEGDGLMVIDMKSSNGTLVNGKQVDKHVLADGDVLGVADTKLVYWRQGDFDKNDAFSAKRAGKSTLQTTQMSSDRLSREHLAAYQPTANASLPPFDTVGEDDPTADGGGTGDGSGGSDVGGSDAGGGDSGGGGSD